MLFRQIFDPKLAQYAYLIGCQQTKEALIIDPERDIDRYVAMAEDEGLAIVAVAETHIHADFLSGAREFAERFGAKLYLSDEGDADWKYEWVKGSDYDYTLLKDGDIFAIGNIEIEAVHTPGHTPEHLSFKVTDHGGGADAPMGIVTGDFVFVGDLGRPDLLESAAKAKGMMEPSARRLYGAVQDFLKWDDYLQVWPAHGAGSSCGKALGAVPETTVGYEKRFSPAIEAARDGEESFVDFILEGQPEPPLYFARMKRDNKLGVKLLDGLPRPRKLTARELGAAAEHSDAIVIDTRLDRSAFMTRHIPGSLYAPLNKSFNTAVGSLIEDETKSLYLIIDEDDLDEAVRDLIRIGYDNVEGFASYDTLERYLSTAPEVGHIDEIDFDRVEHLRDEDGIAVLDVRYASEYDDAHIPGAHNASYTRLPEYLEDLPEADTFLVHCGSGARAAVAAAFLSRTGRSVKYVNDAFKNWTEEHTTVAA